MKESIIQIKGMHCNACEMLVKEALEEQPGVIKADVSHIKCVAIVLFDNNITESQLKSIIKNEGYEVQ